MQAVMLAAGKSTRTWPLTIARPKPLLKVANKTIIEYNLDSLQGIVDEVIIIVGFKKEMISALVGQKYNKLKITYVEQKEQLGTGDALKAAKPHLKGDFILFGGDDIHSKDGFKKLAKEKNALLVQKTDTPERFGVVITEKNKINIIEKPKKFVSNLANVGCYKFSKESLLLLNSLTKSSRNEIEIIDIVQNIKNIKTIEVNDWFSITYPWDLLKANEYFVKNIKTDIKGTIEPNATVKGSIVVGEGTVIKNGVYIEGPAVFGKNCVIGPNCYIRAYTSVGDNCKIGNAVEVKNSILFDGTHVGHLSYLGDSVLGYNVNFGAGTITANLRHDNNSVNAVIKEEKLSTGRRKLGVICGDNVHTGINTSTYPGRMLWPNTATLPGAIIQKNITE